MDRVKTDGQGSGTDSTEEKMLPFPTADEGASPSPSLPPPLSGGTPPADVTTFAGAARSPVPLRPATPAGFLRRALAFLIDLAILDFLYIILAFFGVLGMGFSGEDFLPSSLRVFIPFIAAWFVLFVGYFTFFHLNEGQTPGKRIIRIKVVNKEGELLSHGAVLLRSLGYFLSFCFLGLGFLMAIVGKKKRCLHDFLTGSLVILSE